MFTYVANKWVAMPTEKHAVKRARGTSWADRKDSDCAVHSLDFQVGCKIEAILEAKSSLTYSESDSDSTK